MAEEKGWTLHREEKGVRAVNFATEVPEGVTLTEPAVRITRRGVDHTAEFIGAQPPQVVGSQVRVMFRAPENSTERAPGVYVALVTATRSDGGTASESLALAVSAEARVL